MINAVMGEIGLKGKQLLANSSCWRLEIERRRCKFRTNG